MLHDNDLAFTEQKFPFAFPISHILALSNYYSAFIPCDLTPLVRYVSRLRDYLPSVIDLILLSVSPSLLDVMTCD